VRPATPDGAYRFIYKFDRRSRLEAWHQSEARARLFAPVEPLIESDRFDAYPGLETWFELPGGATPPKWKATLLSWFAIYPSVLAGAYIMDALGFKAPSWLQTLVLTGVVVLVVSYVLAPWLGRLAHRWLYADSRQKPGKESEK
jgi:antibiotic biosynthesis monooxygenase (ABM) superfamily enzyme